MHNGAFSLQRRKEAVQRSRSMRRFRDRLHVADDAVRDDAVARICTDNPARTRVPRSTCVEGLHPK
jgi:hypothetical protein